MSEEAKPKLELVSPTVEELDEEEKIPRLAPRPSWREGGRCGRNAYDQHF